MLGFSKLFKKDVVAWMNYVLVDVNREKMMMLFDDEMMMTIEFRLIQNLWKILYPKSTKECLKNSKRKFYLLAVDHRIILILFVDVLFQQSISKKKINTRDKKKIIQTCSIVSGNQEIIG